MISQQLREFFIAQLENRYQKEAGRTITPLVEAVQKDNNPQILAMYNEYPQAGVINLEGALSLSVLLCQLAFIAPEATVEVMDKLCETGIQNQLTEDLLPIIEAKLSPAALRLLQSERPMSEKLKALFWEQIELAAGQGQIIEDISNFASAYSPELRAGYIAAMEQRESSVAAYKTGYLRPPMKLEELQDCPPNSLGNALYHMLADNGLNIDIIKMDPNYAFGGITDYTGMRIIQTHDIWHVALGYTTDGLDEIALQAFQLAQLGSMFSANLLAMLITKSALKNPPQLPYLIRAICAGWKHGREITPLLPINWETMWRDPVVEIRQRFNLTPPVVNLLAAI